MKRLAGFCFLYVCGATIAFSLWVGYNLTDNNVAAVVVAGILSSPIAILGHASARSSERLL